MGSGTVNDILRKCNVCEKEARTPEELDFFVKAKGKPHGVGTICKPCKRIKSKEHYQKNKEERRISTLNWSRKNKEKRASYHKKWRERNPEKVRSSYNNWERDQLINNPTYSLKKRLRGSLNFHVSRLGKSKSRKTEELIGCSFEELYVHLVLTFLANYGRRILPEDNIHIDHIIPLASASTEEEIYKLNHYSNLQFLLAEDNIRKGAKTDVRI